MNAAGGAGRMSVSNSTPAATGDRRPVFVLVAVTLAAWMAGALWPRALVMLGVYDYGSVYLDSFAVLAAVDAARLGADPTAANTLDPLLRSHVYSDWWLGLRWLGLTRDWNFAVGTSWIAAFAAVIWRTARVRRVPEAVWLATLMISPPVLLAVNRANNDLVILVLLALVGLAATAGAWWRSAVAIGGLVLATGLKYYPAPAALAFFWVRPVRRAPGMVLAAAAAAGVALASVWSTIGRAKFTLSSGPYAMGAPLLWRDLGLDADRLLVPGVLLIAFGAGVFAVAKLTTGLATAGDPRDRLLAVTGTLVVLACFSAGLNYAYRWIFVLWMGLWLWRRAADTTLTAAQKLTVRAACVLLWWALWQDGVLCLSVNLLPHQTVEWLRQLQLVWRLCNQPLQWLLMMLLAGWVLEGFLTIVREWWAERAEARAG